VGKVTNTSFLMTVAAKQQGVRLYDFLDAQFPFFVKESWALSLVAESLKIQNETVSGNPILNAGDAIAFSVQQYIEPAVNTAWKTYWETSELLATYKPANLPVQRTTRNIYNTLTALVRRDLNLPEAQPLHRLDLETAGFVLFAKTNTSAKVWQPKLSSFLQKKMYRAIVWGRPVWKTQLFTCRLATSPKSAIRCKMHCLPMATPSPKLCVKPNEDVEPKSEDPGKISTTYFSVIKSFRKNGDLFSIIECELLTGRKHQIRAMLAHLGHPIVGDKIYAHDGIYYLKRLEDAIQKEDDDMMLAGHHLLVACRVQLSMDNLAAAEGSNTTRCHQLELCSQDKITLTLNDEDYPEEWRKFVACGDVCFSGESY
jgi:23S rRNA pseudouridine1911/1915/1917 synthase